jgi:hypothetical protein
MNPEGMADDRSAVSAPAQARDDSVRGEQRLEGVTRVGLRGWWRGALPAWDTTRQVFLRPQARDDIRAFEYQKAIL